jgi:hypothetical protein
MAIEMNSEKMTHNWLQRPETMALPPRSSIKELVDWYAQARVWDNEFDNFNPDTFEKDSESHIKKIEMDKLWAIVGIQGNETRQVVYGGSLCM